MRQIRYENRAFWRNPAAAFFTFAFPLIFMVVFNAIFGDQSFGQSGCRAAYFFTPAIVAFSDRQRLLHQPRDHRRDGA